MSNRWPLQLKDSSDTLKSLVTKAQGKKESDIIKFVKQKIQTQNELIGAILEKIESKTEGQTLVK